MRNGETVEIEIDTGKRLIIKLETISEPDANKTTICDLSLLDTPTFFFGMRNGETVEIEIDTGKRLIIKLETISEPD
ncbi:hypothetical protein EDM27_17105, partial [Staphylococcus aureus]